jgi:hypothetical protein
MPVRVAGIRISNPQSAETVALEARQAAFEAQSWHPKAPLRFGMWTKKNPRQLLAGDSLP